MIPQFLFLFSWNARCEQTNNLDFTELYTSGRVVRVFPTQSYLLACQDVAGQLDLGEVSLANGLEQAVVADVRLLV